ncbi:MAG: hypothetical protein WCX46_04260 [Candidatus Paceibacterota bacterium]
MKKSKEYKAGQLNFAKNLNRIINIKYFGRYSDVADILKYLDKKITELSN